MKIFKQAGKKNFIKFSITSASKEEFSRRLGGTSLGCDKEPRLRGAETPKPDNFRQFGIENKKFSNYK